MLDMEPQSLVEWLSTNLAVNKNLVGNIIESIEIIAILFFIQFLIRKFGLRRVSNLNSRYRWQKSTRYVLTFVGILLVGSVWSNGLEAVTTFLGILSAGLVIALKDPLVNLAGWLFIIWRRPYQVGDRIQINNFHGDVVDTGLFQTSLMEIGNWVQADQMTGRIIRCPNAKVFTDPVFNYTKGWFEYIWNEIPVMVTFESDWKLTKSILQNIVNKQFMAIAEEAETTMRQSAAEMLVIQSSLKPQVYTTVADSGVVLTIRYLCDPRKRRGTSESLWESILEEFDKHENIALAYPTQRITYSGPDSSSEN